MAQEAWQGIAREGKLMKQRLTNWNAKDSEKSRQKALELCENARGQLVLHYPFVGHLGLQIDFVPVVDSRIRTIATNGKVIYIRPEWICQLPMVTRAAIIAHTIWTAALCHSFRRGDLDARRFDAASDLEVYTLLKAEKVAMAVKPDYADLFPKHKTVEDIFKELPENTAPRSEDADVHLYLAGRINLPELPGQAQEKKQKEACAVCIPCEDGGEGQVDYSQGAGASSGNENASGGENGEQQDGTWDGSATGEQGKDEQDADAGTGGTSNGADAQEAGEVDAAVDTTCDPMMREVWRQRILETAQNYEMMHGLLPGDIAEIVQQFRESKIDYMQKLRRYLTLHSGGDMQWLPPAKRFVWQKMYLPSRSNAALEAVLAIDTSGSTQNYIDKFFGDALKIMRQFGKFHLTVIQCDAKITDVQEYTENSRAPKSLRAKGGGGTDFVPVFKYIEEKRIIPRVMLFFTDGYGEAPDKAPGYPVIWVLTPGGQKPCEWGDVIQIEE
ncbi:MAG: hypothetical protein J5746_10485 [Victivallales bacterium]|nr:hypothetical protein [Victivallales bacterium]